MRPLLNSADAHASFIEAVRLNRIACVRVSATGKVRFDASSKGGKAGADYHTLPVFDLTQLEPTLSPDSDKLSDGSPSPELRARAAEVMHFVSEQLGKGFLSVPYDKALYLQDNKGGTPVIWSISLERLPETDALNLVPFRWASKHQVWLLETIVAVPLTYGRCKVGPPRSQLDDEDAVIYGDFARFAHVGDVERRYSNEALRQHEHEVWVRVMGVLHVIQRLMEAQRGEVVVVEGTHEAMRINSRRDNLGLPKLQPVIRIIELTPRTRWTSGLPSEPTGRTVETHHRRGTIATNKYGTRFPRRATIVNDPARTRDMPAVVIPVPWYEVVPPADC